jgi:branched-chain amino acid aminotransferase
MEFKYFSRNGNILPVGEASVPLSNIEYQYGFGVYETIRIANGMTFFLDEHLERLMESARIIGLEHPFAPGAIAQNIHELVEKNSAQTCNVKILLIGARTKEEAMLIILCLNPLFPDKKLYRDGVACSTYKFERPFPHAKTLNMLQSYLAYRGAREVGAYDALLLDPEGHITEGTRSNFFCIKDRTIFSPPEDRTLLGVTRKAVLQVATQNGFKFEERTIAVDDLGNYDGAFLTSTSSKIMPVRSVDDHMFPGPSKPLQELIAAFDHFLETYRGVAI